MNDLRAKPVDGRLYLALSLAQRAIWMDMRLADEPTAFHIGMVCTVRASLDPDLARQATRVVMGRHDSMRLRFDPIEPRQWFEIGGPTPFRFTDVSDAADPEATAAERIAAARAEGFKLDEAPPFKVELVRVRPDLWRVLFLCHHLAFDGVSQALVQREWLDAYRTLSGEEEADTAAPTRPSYRGVVEADEAYQSSARYEQDLAYWRERLAEPPSPIFSPTLGAPVEDDGEPEAEPVRLDAAALGRLEAACSRAGTTLHQALIGLFAIALARRYGRNDVIIGMALHRREAGTRRVVGCLAGLMPVRCRLPAAASLSRAVAGLSEDLVADLGRHRAPVDAIARSLAATDPSAAHAREGLFDAVVTIMPSFLDAPPTLGGQPVEGEPVRANERAALALRLTEMAARQGLVVETGRRRGALPAREARRFQAVFLNVVEAFATGKDLRVGAIEGLAADEGTALRSWSYGVRKPIPEADLTTLFERIVAQQPHAPAAVSDAGELTYAELDRAANRVAARLRASGVTPGAAVGVAIRRSLESVVAILGVLKAEAVYLPLDPDYPPERLAGMIDDADATMALTTPDVAPLLPAAVRAMAFADGFPLAGEPTQAPVRASTSATARAYIVFTSGSTGRPKGVAVSHGALVNLAWARREHDPIGPGDRVLAAISIGFDVSLGQLLTPLLAGATVAVAGDIRGLSADGFWAFVTRHGVTHVNSVPSFFASVLDAAPQSTPLKKIMLGGEPLSGALALRLRQKLGVPLFNMYGPTEACIDATGYAAPSEGIESVAVLPIGRPLPNYAALVLDTGGRLAPIGVEGELCIGGPSLAEGYLGQPQMTAERFVETPDFGRLYRTGDRAAWGEDGELRFLGRADAQVKIRGFRVELGEIEAALAAIPGVIQAAVVARRDARGETGLAGYYVGTAETEAARAALKRRLPSHMVPSVLVRLQALPLTINGKLDERALPEPQMPAARLTPPRTPTERLVAEAFADLFPGAAIGVESHFFDLGGHSLIATQLATRLRAARGIELPLRVLFEQPRLEDLAREIDALAPRTSLPALTPRARPERIPLSPAQERLWFLAQMDPQSPTYNIPVAFRIAGRLEADVLMRALSRLSDRHESLRTRFPSEQGLPYQDILPRRAPDLSVFDLGGATEAEIRAAAEREALKPFHLERDPLVRAALLHLAPDADLLLLTIHHIVADGASMFILLPELAALYGEEAGAGPAKLATLTAQFADYALWRRERGFAARDEESLAFWRRTLQGAPETLALPTDFPRPERMSGRGDSVALDLGPELSAAVRSFARVHRATPFVVLAAAFAALLARRSGQDDIVLGAPLANRGTAETEGMVAFLVNTIALRARVEDAPDFATLVARLRESVIEAHAHGDFPFERLVAALSPERSLGRNPIFQAMFALQPKAPGDLAFAGRRAEAIVLMEKVAKFDLTLNLTDGAESFSGALTFATDLFAKATIAQMAEQWKCLLAEALASPFLSYTVLPLAGVAARAALAAAGDGPKRPLSAATIPALFAERVALQPEAQAVVFGSKRLTYAELDAAANRLARALLAAGARTGRAVATILPRSQALVVAALGTMKAGAVYLPIDPATPQARVAAMLADAEPAVVIADQTTGSRAPGFAVLDIENLGEEPAVPPEVAFGPEATAYLIYTSGSTGQPKGVAVGHAALAALADARLAHDPIGPGDRVLATMSVGFDVSIGQLVTPLLSGATVVVAPPLAGLSGAEFWGLMAAQAITHVNSGPAFLDAVLETPPPTDLPLKRLMLGGEPFPTALARKIAATLPRAEIFNMYGPTEACIDATCHRFRGDETGATLPIGRALPNYRVLILDEALNALPEGVEGEIFIGGPSLAQGYLNRAEETQARFLADPFGRPGDRLYRTGDRARLNARGEIEFLGRSDAQVKIRGHRIEPDEVAAVLRREPSVASAAVVARPRGQETCLVAYVAAAPDAAPTAARLRALAEAALPGYMIPAAYVVLPALPTTINGKLDLKALPPPDFETEIEAEPTPPRDELDAMLIEIWRALLETPQIGIDHNFFRLGGHSLLALRVVAAVKGKLNLDLPIAEIYRSQTVRALADAIRAGEATKRRGPLVPLGDGPGRPVFAFHPVGGGAFGYLGLAEALSGRHPVYGVQAAGLEPEEPVAATLDEMVESYMGAILARQPHGPYAFVGHSFGGLVAFEIAHRLEAAGETIERLILSDTSPAGEPWTMELAERTGKRIVRLERARAGKTDEPIDEARERRVIAVVANCMRLAESYTPPRIAAPLIYVLARRGDLPPDGRRAYWEARSEHPIRVPPLDCEHQDVMDRHNVRKLAAFID